MELSWAGSYFFLVIRGHGALDVISKSGIGREAGGGLGNFTAFALIKSGKRGHHP